MTEQEQQQQIMQAKANLRLLERCQAPAPELEEARQQLAALQHFSPSEFAKRQVAEPVVIPRPARAPIPVEQLPVEVRERIETLTTERNAIHAEKAGLSNTLHSIPDSMSAADTVKRILALREAWKSKQDAIRLLLELGALPAVQTPNARELPNDEEKLRYQIQCLQSNIIKAGKRSQGAKNDSTRQRNAVMIARWQAEIEQLRAKLQSL
ncbi:hypothetical protein [Fibrella aquatilis]|uniref:Uncharacterized protein n=1 Tax=Fibrella aquatilis TaxID=2817059 RepID=A0A939G9W5_9BACT|nr:hypothetical protein [Fibrella aquatilis]MBO0933913.1 hypothetical protein [Fibrella aquatilis]